MMNGGGVATSNQSGWLALLIGVKAVIPDENALHCGFGAPLLPLFAGG